MPHCDGRSPLVAGHEVHKVDWPSQRAIDADLGRRAGVPDDVIVGGARAKLLKDGVLVVPLENGNDRVRGLS